MKYKVALQTDVGIKKETNQDSCCIKEAATDEGYVVLAVICDGMGGLAKGEVASASLVTAFSNWFENVLPAALATADVINEIKCQWKRLIQEQNRRITEYGKACHISLGSTITAIIILENGDYLIGHVGDSRVYKITDDSIDILTEDQTVVADEVKKGRLSADKVDSDPRRNILLQCVGASDNVVPAFYKGKVSDNECYMLCSDGFRHKVNNNEIQVAFSPADNVDEEIMNHNLTRLIELNKQRDESDNITALLIRPLLEV